MSRARAPLLARLGGEIEPPVRVLLLCARVDLDARGRDELAGCLRGDRDGTALVEAARRHGLVPLLSRQLDDQLDGPLPGGLLARVRAEARANALSSLAQAAELVDLLAALHAAGVPASAVKGPVSAALCYGDLGLRTFGDLDLLVTPADVPAASAVLQSRGYLPQFALSPPWLRHLVRHGCELLFVHGDRRRLVDLHWSLLPQGYSFTPRSEPPFDARQTVSVGPARVPTLGAEATLLFLLLHGVKHAWRSLGWLADVGQLVRRTPGLDWGAVLAWSRPRSRRRQIDLGLALAHGLIEAPVPELVLERGRGDPDVDRLSERLARSLLESRAKARAALPETIFSATYLRAMASASDRLRFLHDVALRPTPLEWAAVPLPVAAAPLHYLVRPVRLLLKHGAGVLSRFAG